MGFSAPGVLTGDMVKTHGPGRHRLRLRQPHPGDFPRRGQGAGARVVGTGRSDYPNQINNVLAFPGIFRGALDVRAPGNQRRDEAGRRQGPGRPHPPGGAERGDIIPSAFDKRWCRLSPAAVAQAARDTGVART